MTSIFPLVVVVVVVFLLVVAIAVPIAIRTNIDDRLLISWRGKGGLNGKKLFTLPHNPTCGSGFNIDCLIRVNVTSCVQRKTTNASFILRYKPQK